MSIPELQTNGELPPGEHIATLDEVEAVYGVSTFRRQQLMLCLRDAAKNMAQAGVQKIWINGSFVTNKPNPSDIDGCWEYTNQVDVDELDPVFFSTLPEMKAKYGMEFFISSIIEAGAGVPFPQFFQTNRNGVPKGIIVVQLGG